MPSEEEHILQAFRKITPVYVMEIRYMAHEVQTLPISLNHVIPERKLYR